MGAGCSTCGLHPLLQDETAKQVRRCTSTRWQCRHTEYRQVRMTECLINRWYLRIQLTPTWCLQANASASSCRSPPDGATCSSFDSSETESTAAHSARTSASSGGASWCPAGSAEFRSPAGELLRADEGCNWQTALSAAGSTAVCAQLCFVGHAGI
jgi:hypothetical protein